LPSTRSTLCRSTWDRLGAIRNDIEWGNPATGWGSLEYPAAADVWRSRFDTSNHTPDSIRAEVTSKRKSCNYSSKECLPISSAAM
jgi:hypothetical protein